jgi:hypothetical protein
MARGDRPATPRRKRVTPSGNLVKAAGQLSGRRRAAARATTRLTGGESNCSIRINATAATAADACHRSEAAPWLRWLPLLSFPISCNASCRYRSRAIARMDCSITKGPARGTNDEWPFLVTVIQCADINERKVEYRQQQGEYESRRGCQRLIIGVIVTDSPRAHNVSDMRVGKSKGASQFRPSSQLSPSP